MGCLHNVQFSFFLSGISWTLHRTWNMYAGVCKQTRIYGAAQDTLEFVQTWPVCPLLESLSVERSEATKGADRRKDTECRGLIWCLDCLPEYCYCFYVVDQQKVAHPNTYTWNNNSCFFLHLYSSNLTLLYLHKHHKDQETADMS